MCCLGGISVVWGMAVPTQCQGLVLGLRCSFLSKQAEGDRKRDLVFQCQKGQESIRLEGGFQVCTWCLRMHLGPGHNIPEMWFLLHVISSSFPLSSSSPTPLIPQRYLELFTQTYCSKVLRFPLPQILFLHSSPPSTSLSLSSSSAPAWVKDPYSGFPKNPEQTSLITFSTLD